MKINKQRLHKILRHNEAEGEGLEAMKARLESQVNQLHQLERDQTKDMKAVLRQLRDYACQSKHAEDRENLTNRLEKLSEQVCNQTVVRIQQDQQRFLLNIKQKIPGIQKENDMIQREDSNLMSLFKFINSDVLGSLKIDQNNQQLIINIESYRDKTTSKTETI